MNIVSINDIRDRFYTEDIELVCVKPLQVEMIAGAEWHHANDTWNTTLSLHFGQIGDSIKRDYTANLETDQGFNLHEYAIALGINPNEHIWHIGPDETLLSLDDVLGVDKLEQVGLMCVKSLQVEIALYRGQDEDDRVTNNMGIQLHLAPFDTPTIDEEPGPWYDYCAWLDSELAMSEDGIFTFDDVIAAFDIDPNERIWEVGDPG